PNNGFSLKKLSPELIICILLLVLPSTFPSPVKLANKPSIRDPSTLYKNGLFKEIYPTKIKTRPINPSLVNLFLSLYNKLNKPILKTNINNAFLEPVKTITIINNNMLNI